MALRTYSSDTLNDNWAEERSEPLRGVLSDFGHREYETTNKTAFPPTPCKSSLDARGWSKATWQQHQQRQQQSQVQPAAIFNTLSMAQACTAQEAMCPRPFEDRGFNSLFGRTRSEVSTVNLGEPETTSAAAFGVPKRASRTALRSLHAPDAPPCGLVEIPAKDAGASRIMARPIGERFMESEEPAQSTAAQRSWMYSHDPVIKYHDEGVPVAPAAEGLSIDVGDGPRGGNVNNKRSRNITLQREPNRQRGTSIWIDYHIAPGEA